PLMHSKSPQQSVPFARLHRAPKAPQQTWPIELVLHVRPLQQLEAAVHGRVAARQAGTPVSGGRLSAGPSLPRRSVAASRAAAQTAPPPLPLLGAGPITSGTGGEMRASSTSTVAVP